jgi:hypothetical protein
VQVLGPEERDLARMSLLSMATLGSASLLGVAFSLYLVNHYPLLLIALSPLGRHLVLVAPIVDPAAFLLVAVARRMVFYLSCFGLGRALGPAGIVWIEARNARFGRFVRWLERLFARASRLVVVGMVGPTVSMLAGSSGMRAVIFAPLATLGILLRMLVVLGFAEWFRVYIEAILAWIDQYWIPGTVLMVGGVLVYRFRKRRAPGLTAD